MPLAVTNGMLIACAGKLSTSCCACPMVEVVSAQIAIGGAPADPLLPWIGEDVQTYGPEPICREIGVYGEGNSDYVAVGRTTTKEILVKLDTAVRVEDSVISAVLRIHNGRFTAVSSGWNEEAYPPDGQEPDSGAVDLQAEISEGQDTVSLQFRAVPDFNGPVAMWSIAFSGA